MNGMPETGTSYFSFVYLGTESVKKSYLSVQKKLGLININFKLVPVSTISTIICSNVHCKYFCILNSDSVIRPPQRP